MLVEKKPYTHIDFFSKKISIFHRNLLKMNSGEQAIFD